MVIFLKYYNKILNLFGNVQAYIILGYILGTRLEIYTFNDVWIL